MDGLIDKKVMGRLLRGARIIEGFDSVADAAKAIREMTGVKVTDRALYQIERGEVMPSFELVLAMSMVYRPPGGTTFLDRAYRPEILEFIEKVRREDRGDGLPG